MFNEALKLDYINPAGEMLFEISAKRMHGFAVDNIFPNNDALVTAMRDAFETGRPFTEREIVLTLHVMRTTSVDCSVTPLFDVPQGKALLVELNPTERVLRISREENHFSQSNAIRALIRGLAHEVKNPLGGLRGAAQLLERDEGAEQRCLQQLCCWAYGITPSLFTWRQDCLQLEIGGCLNLFQGLDNLLANVAGGIGSRPDLFSDLPMVVPPFADFGSVNTAKI